MIESSINKQSIRVLNIIYGTSVDGVGLRTSIYCAGCRHHCEGCHNPESWNENGGTEMSVNDIFEKIEEADLNVTYSGGDPMLHPDGFIELSKMIKEKTNKTIWCYTGYLFEDLLKNEKQKELLQYIDVLVDGPFVLKERDISLRFKGSPNQRIIDIPKSLNSGKVILYQFDM